MLRGERGQDGPCSPCRKAPLFRCRSITGMFLIRSAPRIITQHSVRPAHLSPCQNALIGTKLRTLGSASLKSDSSHRQQGLEDVPHTTSSGRKNLTETVAITVLTLRKARLIYHLCPKFPVQSNLSLHMCHLLISLPPLCPLILTVTYWSQVKRWLANIFFKRPAQQRIIQDEHRFPS